MAAFVIVLCDLVDIMAAPRVPLNPHQQTLTYKQTFSTNRVTKHLFRMSWFQKWKWLRYDESNDLAFCHTCMTANSEAKLRCQSLEPAFITRGCNNWKNATMLFCKHEECGCHEDATQVVITCPVQYLTIYCHFCF